MSKFIKMKLSEARAKFEGTEVELDEIADTPKGKQALGRYITKAAGSAADNGMKHGMKKAEACMLDTSMGGVDQIAQSKTGEVYKNSSKQSTGPSPATGTATHIVAGKTGEAVNATGITKRVPAVESAVLDVMVKTFEKRKMFEDASNIAIISPEQRHDWLEVSKGSMAVVDYFNKYKV